MTELEFIEEKIKEFDERYHSNEKVPIKLLDELEEDYTIQADFRDYLSALSYDYPKPEGVFLRLLFRDFIYNNYDFVDKNCNVEMEK